MWIIVGLIWLYFWLTGWWFARAVAFLGLGCAFGLTAAKGNEGDPVLMWMFIAAAFVAAWLVSGIPIYVRRAMATAVGSKVLLDVPFEPRDSEAGSGDART